MNQEFTQELKNKYHKDMMDVHTIVPGKILSFDPGRQEAKIKPTAKYRLPDDSLRDFPDINHVPVFFPQGIGQTAAIIWKVQKDDECFLFFSEQALDLWRTGAESETDLRFDLTNAFALVGLHPKPNPLVKRAYDNESIIVQRKETFIEWFDKKIEVYTDGDIYGKADLTINVEAGIDINVKAGVNITVKAGADIEIEAGGNVTVEAGGDVIVEAGGDMTLEAAGDMTLKAANIHLNP